MFCHVHPDWDNAKQKMKNTERMYQHFHTQSWGARQTRKKYQIADNNLVSLTKTWWDDSWLQHQHKRCNFPHTTRAEWSAVLYIKSSLYFCPTWTVSFGAPGTQLWPCLTHSEGYGAVKEKAAASHITPAGEGDLVAWDVFTRSGRSPDAEGAVKESPSSGKTARRFVLSQTKVFSFYWRNHPKEMRTAFTVNQVEMSWQVKHIIPAKKRNIF